MNSITIWRLSERHYSVARLLVTLMADVFGEEYGDEYKNLSDSYLSHLLMRKDFWMLVALMDGNIIGGLTAHQLPMTRSESSELFIYDLAVHTQHQRKGIGRSLVDSLCTMALEAGISYVFVPADNEDTHALDFYSAIGGTPSPVTFFSFEISANEKKIMPK
ncbi:MAG: GNAT family N-acetyltransferase [Candidatus Kapabacteria bacterium]|nr:GNAT family N-acetyltransferase [Candidatus Kapabacteria bacterium]